MQRVVITVLACGVLAWGGCSDSDETLGLGEYPQVLIVASYNANDPEEMTPSYQFHVGDRVSFTVRARDRDKDMTTLVCTEYDISAGEGNEVLLNGPDEVSLPRKTDEIVTFQYIYTITIEGGAGPRRMVFNIRDARGKLGVEDYRCYADYTVEE